jgi:hypothetical protein
LPVWFIKRDGVCLLRGTKLTIKCNSGSISRPHRGSQSSQF